MSVPAADNLRRIDMDHQFVNLPNAHAFITTQTPLKAAADLLEAIDALHQPFCVDYGAPTTCQTCDEYWPCSTARLLHPEKES